MAVFKELRAEHPKVELRFWCDFGFYKQAKSTTQKFDPDLRVDRVVSGKLRRYAHLSFLQHFTVPAVVFKNLRDGFFVGIGYIQSLVKLILWRPDVVFAKGGFVCLPVGLAAATLRIPLVIHDSDAHPGLTNRVLSRFARFIGTGAPLEYYPYSPSKARYIGIPVSDAFKPASAVEQRSAKQHWQVSSDKPLIVVTGGGLGARRINDLIVGNISKLLNLGSVILVSGAGQYDELRAAFPDDDERFRLYSFITDMPSLLKASDVVIARAGATTILELAALGKPTILIPNVRLTGDHQTKNAEVYVKAGALMAVGEDEAEKRPKILIDAVAKILTDEKFAAGLSHQFQKFSRPNAAKDMAKLVLAAVKK